MSTAILYIKNLSGFRNGNITIETQATNGLELAEDIIKSFGNKELKVSEAKSVVLITLLSLISIGFQK